MSLNYVIFLPHFPVFFRIRIERTLRTADSRLVGQDFNVEGNFFAISK